MKRWLKLAAVNVAVLFGLVIVVEGGTSLLLVFRDITVMAWEAAPYSEYDPDLGWIAKPNASVPDFWGPGVGVRTNAQRFRAAGEIASAVPPGKVRVVCTGDSFTFGDGVGNADTWCQQLASRDPRIEPVNLGQGGYGADQAYLRFLRDTKTLSHQVHLFAFIDDDFRRMQFDTFLGFGKPVLALENGVLATRNVPVPRTATSMPWLIAFPRAVMETRTALFAKRVMNRLSAPPPADAAKDAETKTILRAMFAELKRVNDLKGSRLMLVHLTSTDQPAAVDPWYPFLAQAAQAEGVPLIDAVSAFRARTDIRGLFLSKGTAAGHYNAAGNALVADVVNAELQRTLGR